MNVTYIPNAYGGINWSWLKGGSIRAGAWYFLPPSRVYYENGRKSTLYSLPPFLFAMSLNAIYGSNIVSYNNAVGYTDTSETSASYILEYDQATTVSAMRISVGNNGVGTVVNGINGIYTIGMAVRGSVLEV